MCGRWPKKFSAFSWRHVSFKRHSSPICVTWHASLWNSYLFVAPKTFSVFSSFYLRLSNLHGATLASTTRGRSASAAEDWRGHANEAPALLREMAAAGLKPDESCFTNALSACRDRRQGKEAVAILREMDEAGVAPDGVVYTLVSWDCCVCPSVILWLCLPVGDFVVNSVFSVRDF